MTALPPNEFLLPPQVVVSSSTRLTQPLNRQLSPESVVLLLAVLIGSSTGMGVVTFHYLIQLIHHLMLENLMGVIAVWGTWILACIPTLGGLIIGLMRWRWQNDFGPGLAALIAAAHGNSIGHWAPLSWQSGGNTSSYPPLHRYVIKMNYLLQLRYISSQNLRILFPFLLMIFKMQPCRNLRLSLHLDLIV